MGRDWRLQTGLTHLLRKCRWSYWHSSQMQESGTSFNHLRSYDSSLYCLLYVLTNFAIFLLSSHSKLARSSPCMLYIARLDKVPWWGKRNSFWNSWQFCFSCALLDPLLISTMSPPTKTPPVPRHYCPVSLSPSMPKLPVNTSPPIVPHFCFLLGITFLVKILQFPVLYGNYSYHQELMSHQL